MIANGIGCSFERETSHSFRYTAHIDFIREGSTCSDDIIELSVQLRFPKQLSQEDEDWVQRKLLNDLYNLLHHQKPNFVWQEEWKKCVKSVGNERADEYEEFVGCWERIFYHGEINED